jgi:hypothetical protein
VKCPLRLMTGGAVSGRPPAEGRVGETGAAEADAMSKNTSVPEFFDSFVGKYAEDAEANGLKAVFQTTGCQQLACSSTKTLSLVLPL